MKFSEESFFNRLEKLRSSMSKADFSRKTGISQPLYQKWMAGAIPSGDKLKLIADAFDVSVDWLLTGRDNISFSVSRDFRDRFLQACDKLDVSPMKIIEIMGVKNQDVQDIIHKKKPETYEITHAFDKKIDPLLEELKEKGYVSNPVIKSRASINPAERHCPNCTRLESDIAFLKDDIKTKNLVIEDLLKRKAQSLTHVSQTAISPL